VRGRLLKDFGHLHFPFFALSEASLERRVPQGPRREAARMDHDDRFRYNGGAGLTKD
jgi:hypothetical protein